VSLAGDVVAYFRLRDHWWGPAGFLQRLAEHAEMSFSALAFAVVLAVPVAVWLGHKRRFGLLAVNVSNVGRAVPSFAILVVGAQLAGLQSTPIVGSWFVFVALVVLAIPPMVTNSYVALAGVSDDLRDAARGTGLSDAQSLWKVELPVALPLLMAGVRTSAVQVVSTATIAAVVGAGGLGRYIVDGVALGQAGSVRVVAGSLLVALFAIVTEVTFALLQRVFPPRGLRRVHTAPDAVHDIEAPQGALVGAA
jgi:osmoprotectant transport system permease protein